MLTLVEPVQQIRAAIRHGAAFSLGTRRVPGSGILTLLLLPVLESDLLVLHVDLIMSVERVSVSAQPLLFGGP